jgi:hypothetical protein
MRLADFVVVYQRHPNSSSLGGHQPDHEPPGVYPTIRTGACVVTFDELAATSEVTALFETHWRCRATVVQSRSAAQIVSSRLRKEPVR